MGVERQKTLGLPFVLFRIGLTFSVVALLYFFYASSDDLGKLLVKIGGMIWLAVTYIVITIEKTEARIAAQIEDIHRHLNELDVPRITWKDVLNDQNP